MTRRRKFSPAQCAELATAWNSGVPLKTLAYRYQADPKTIALAIRNYDEPTGIPRGTIGDIQLQTQQVTP